MKIVKTISELKKEIYGQKLAQKTIGFVPTMGALHQGHLSLIDESIKNTEFTVCSIFINPLQFNNKNDFDKYPSTIDEDLKLLEAAGCDLVFCPSKDEIYQKEPSTRMSFGSIENVLEGKHRPGHFNGVGIIVSKLFHLVEPDVAFFGQKDLQQFCIIKQMVDDLNFPIDLRMCPIIREESGLAMSSRNKRLSSEQKEKASQIYQTLLAFEKKLQLADSPLVNTHDLISHLAKFDFETEYLSCVELDSLEEVKKWAPNKEYAICYAGVIGEVRLIDNYLFSKN